MYYVNNNQKKTKVVMLILSKTYFRTRKILWIRRALHNDKKLNFNYLS